MPVMVEKAVPQLVADQPDQHGPGDLVAPLYPDDIALLDLHHLGVLGVDPRYAGPQQHPEAPIGDPGHPQEDFAETFRFYLTRRGKLRELFAEFGRKRKGVVVYEKFLALHDYVRSLRA